ncbi:hypothetical protein JXO59_14595 [candidate division KSB1 bacterium]|nr:hypothetical protein [candidate division KSB1 bacterium]
MKMMQQIRHTFSDDENLSRAARGHSNYLQHRLRSYPISDNNLGVGVETNHFYEDTHASRQYHDRNRLTVMMRLIGMVEYVTIKNQEHKTGSDASFWRGRLGLSLEGWVKVRVPG